MPDWKEMYLSLMRDTERAIRILEEGQRKCEELYLADEGPVLRVLPETPDSRDQPAAGPESGLCGNAQKTWWNPRKNSTAEIKRAVDDYGKKQL